MKFGEFFGKYTLCSVIYSVISILIAGAMAIGIYAVAKKQNATIEATDSESTLDEE